MRAINRCRRLAGANPYLMDALLALALYLFVIAGSQGWVDRGGPHRDESDPMGGLGLVLTGVTFAVLTLRRRWPLAVLAGTTAGALVLMFVEEPRHPFNLAAAVAAYTVAVRFDRMTALWSSGASAVAMGAGAVLFSTASWTESATLLVMVFTAMTTAVGMAVGTRRAYVAAVEERARRAEQSREEEAHRRVIEERLRIARELHDVVAHHIALINVQAGVAAHLVRSDADAASVALAHVRSASRSVLSELSTLLGVLRTPDDSDAPVEPAPGLDRLDGLLESFGATGLPLTSRCHGRRRPLPAGVDLAAYRIIQEALTNVHKHGGGGPADVELDYGPDRLVIRIGNPAVPARRDGTANGAANGNGAADGIGTGHGLLGMRERVAALGGTFEAGVRPDGGFAVYALLPLPRGADGDDPGPAGR